MAGYAFPEVDGSRLLGSARVKAEIAAHADQTMSRAEVLVRLRDLSDSDASDFAGLVGLTDPKAIKAELARLKRKGISHRIKKLTPTKNGLSVELHSSHDALVRLGQAHGIFAERVQVEQGIDYSKLTLDELRALDEKVNGPAIKRGSMN
jgi:hypothetical protein